MKQRMQRCLAAGLLDGEDAQSRERQRHVPASMAKSAATRASNSLASSTDSRMPAAPAASSRARIIGGEGTHRRNEASSFAAKSGASAGHGRA